MKKLINEKLNINILKYLVLFILALPLVYSNYFLYPTIGFKNFIFRVIIEIALLFYLLLVIKNKEYLPRKNIILFSFLIFLVISFISSLINTSFYSSFFSSFERMEGLINYLHLFIFLIILASIFKNKKDWLLFFRWSLFISLLVSLYAIFQKFNFSFVLNLGADRLDSTLGNPSFLAAYLLFNVFLGLYIISKLESKFSKFLYGLITLVNLIVIYFTGTKGVILALAFVFFIYLIYAIIKYKGYKKVIPGLLILIIIISSLYIFISKKDKLEEFQQSTSVKNRFLVWQISLEAFKEKPIFGWGEGNFDVAYNKYYNPELKEIYFDHAHNIIIDIGVKYGILGIAAYLFILFAIFKSLRKSWQEKRINNSEFLLFSLLILAYFIQNLFLFDSINSFIYFILILSYISFLSGGLRLEIKKNIYLVIFLIIFLPLVIYLLIYYNIRPALANYYATQAVSAAPVDPYLTVEYYNKALKLNTFGQVDLLKQASEVAIKSNSSPVYNYLTRQELFSVITEKYEQLLEKNPYKMRLYLSLGVLYLNNHFVENNIEKAKDYLLEAQKLGPQKLEINDILSRIYFLEKDYQKALDQVEIVLFYDFNKSDFLFRKAIFNLYLDNLKAGEQALNESINSGRELDFPDIMSLAQAYEENEHYLEAIEYYKKSLENSINRNDAGIKRAKDKLYELYLKVGNLEEANKIKERLL
ncbi:MAG: O-antigen ligase family protein [Patescibacteria group bacterium]